VAQPETFPRARSYALWTFAVASLLTVVLGGLAMLAGGAPISITVRNPIAWLVAGALAIFAGSRGWLGGWGLFAAPIVIALGFLSPDQEGVHRWLDIGPVQLNAAALVLPLAIATLARAQSALAAASFVAMGALLAWQPDISQLASFAAAAIILARVRFGWRGLAIAALLAAGAIAFCLTVPDPLAPVAHVEGIFALAWKLSPILAVAMGLALAAATLSPMLALKVNPGAPALAVYFALAAIMPVFGAYPVPLAGYGLSFVIGWWLGIASLNMVKPV
jgi:hypothetical protein